MLPKSSPDSNSPNSPNNITEIFVCVCLVAQSCATLHDPMNCSPPGSSVFGDFLGKNTGAGAMPSSCDLPNPGIEPRSPTSQADSLQSELPGIFNAT